MLLDTEAIAKGLCALTLDVGLLGCREFTRYIAQRKSDLLCLSQPIRLTTCPYSLTALDPFNTIYRVGLQQNKDLHRRSKNESVEIQSDGAQNMGGKGAWGLVKHGATHRDKRQKQN